ncbi:MAG: type II toxin-antitoxin system mRNA interferase toxin, RelE/StbE family [Candidatus Pacebacteria bacterium CG_4_10_14_3_um_filter_34_15]|nr:type II toxin-antitoxin system mRNA interferase toxin, RelE/StbE family [Candidatus Pacearchaeota archaeon]NCQ65365.1 type II toxin-antitoxin system mRNA interferase toxin, RelE/StbE family [Candidatus Paceibacterota bacterium]OIO44251.1 MAG: hypothetical protein AUJ41_03665 [Candidatus Pacebacteria bacterium CG1_02_43_31]PIQ80749.1 MAG: type II toxin-antitoxin system mRNA interferase toxin, RelE/StbE family [Candidatus Pacebacteria bacterium CG11_big_fil_rev_8_21_14_0_20_34_55]PIX81790.1 MA
MKASFSPKCLRQLQKLKKTNAPLFKKVQKQLKIFDDKLDHPSLRLHKLSGAQKECWSISIDKSFRLLFYYQQRNKQHGIVFFSFGTHGEVYK